MTDCPFAARTLLCSIAWLTVATTACMGSPRDAAIANGATLLSKAEAEAALSDHTLVGSLANYDIDFALYHAADRRLIGRIAGTIKDRDRGSWRVLDDGKLCLRWSHWEDNNETCRGLYREGNAYKVFDEKSGKLVSAAKSIAGNPHKLEVRSDLEIAQSKETLAPVSAEAMRALVPGNTVSGRAPAMKNADTHVFYAKDKGLAFLYAPAAVIKDHGTFRIDEDGKVCATWGYLQGGHETCETWLTSATDAGSYRVFDAYGSLVMNAKLRSGDPEQLGK